MSYVEQLIEQRGLGPGDRIATKEDLREQTTAARATINEAVRLLQNRGRVTIRPGPGGGLFVATTSPLVRFGQTLLAVSGDADAVTVGDVIVVRDALEPLIAMEAARHRKPVDIFELRNLVDEMAAAISEGPAFLRANWRLHGRMAEIARNTVLQAVYMGLMRYIEDSAAGGERAPRRAAHLEDMLELHRELVEAVAVGDVEQARALGERHASQLQALSQA